MVPASFGFSAYAQETDRKVHECVVLQNADRVKVLNMKSISLGFTVSLNRRYYSYCKVS